MTIIHRSEQSVYSISRVDSRFLASSYEGCWFHSSFYHNDINPNYRKPVEQLMYIKRK